MHSLYSRISPPPDYDAILADLHWRFSSQRDEGRSLPLELASPPPPDPAPVVPRVYKLARTAEKDAARLIFAREMAKPKKARKAYVRVVSEIRQRTVFVDGVERSKVALAPCSDGGLHDWAPWAKKIARCAKCDRKVLKRLIPDLVLTRRTRVARTELPPCTDPRGHTSPLARDGQPSKGVIRLRCNRCGQSRKATAEEMAGMVTA